MLELEPGGNAGFAALVRQVALVGCAERNSNLQDCQLVPVTKMRLLRSLQSAREALERQ